MLASIAGISLLVGGIGIFSVMQISISERVFEIGLRKAIGATDPEIFGQFLIESVSLSLVGGAIGAALGYGITLLAAQAFPDGLSVSPLGARARGRLRDRDRPRRRRLSGAARLAPDARRRDPRVGGSRHCSSSSPAPSSSTWMRWPSLRPRAESNSRSWRRSSSFRFPRCSGAALAGHRVTVLEVLDVGGARLDRARNVFAHSSTGRTSKGTANSWGGRTRAARFMKSAQIGRAIRAP